jgi:hypothetical protein
MNELIPEWGKSLKKTRHASGASWESEGFDTKVRRVCRPCNNGWMSDMERSTMPLLTPMMLGRRTTPLSADEQKQIGIWGYKTGIMLALAYKEDEQWVPPGDYRFFYEHRRPPDGTWIWLATLDVRYGDELRLGWSHPEKLEFHTPDGRRHYPDGYRLSFSGVALVFQIVKDPHGAKLDRPKQFRDFWTRVRPISKGQWPPAGHLRTVDLDQVTLGRFIPVV